MLLQTFKLVPLLSLVSFLGLVGCGASSDVPLADVSGVVTDDKGPVAGATVEFYPKKGRPSYATTGTDGRYSLVYSEELTGAVIGPHEIRVTTGGTSSAPPSDSEEVLEKPAKTVAMPGTMEVAAGENTIDLDLTQATPVGAAGTRGQREVLEPPAR